jgi:hypothetical protein
MKIGSDHNELIHSSARMWASSHKAHAVTTTFTCYLKMLCITAIKFINMKQAVLLIPTCADKVPRTRTSLSHLSIAWTSNNTSKNSAPVQSNVNSSYCSFYFRSRTKNTWIAKWVRVFTLSLAWQHSNYQQINSFISNQKNQYNYLLCQSFVNDCDRNIVL